MMSQWQCGWLCCLGKAGSNAMSETIYDSPYSCNKCGKPLKHNHYPFGSEHSGEFQCKCDECGHEDWWCFGFWQSGEDGLSASEKYVNDAGTIRIHTSSE